MTFFTWTDEPVRVLESMWTNGKFAVDIAKAIGGGLTKNAIIGKARRMGFKRPDYAPGTRYAPHKTPRKNPAYRPKVANRSRIVSAPPDIVPLHISLGELTSTTCRFPYGTVAPYTFCGHPILEESPYCPFHHIKTHWQDATIVKPRPVFECAGVAA